jgi:hypothetical protein
MPDEPGPPLNEADIIWSHLSLPADRGPKLGAGAASPPRLGAGAARTGDVSPSERLEADAR